MRLLGSLIILFRSAQHIHGSMDDSQNVNLVCLYVVDDTEGTFDHFANLVNIIFGDSTA